MATKEEVGRFLIDFKHKLGFWGLILRSDRDKNFKTLTILEYQIKDVKKELNELEVENYSQGPVVEMAFGGAAMWIFGKAIQAKEVYIKISLGQPNNCAVCISFHFAEHDKVPLQDQVNMKSPITGKEMVLKTEVIGHDFRKEQFEVVYHYYWCEESKEKFEDERLAQLNLNQVYNQFRKKHKLPFPEEIIALRDQYGLSASKMSEVLGFGINVYRNYENGEIPNSSNARLIQLAQDPKEFKRLVELSDVLTAKETEKVMARIDELLLKDEFTSFNLQNYLMGERAADDHTGYRIPNLAKFTEMVVFYTYETEPWKTKLNKLLFYGDFCHFRKTGMSMSGCRYRAIDMGPVPNNFNSIFEHIADRGDVDIHYTEFLNGSIGEQFKPHPKRKFNDTIFEEDELTTLREVVSKFGKTNTKEIIEISHEEEIWQKNFHDGKKLISYIEAFKLKNM